jgi:hypothetical protein
MLDVLVFLSLILPLGLIGIGYFFDFKSKAYSIQDLKDLGIILVIVVGVVFVTRYFCSSSNIDLDYIYFVFFGTILFFIATILFYKKK